ncbi:regulating synaptic membrane exocytosis protein 4-like isoform X1 [Lethenteron reissneri]|uniref:regulating synaptic membrane exocytosis protein 4-like n=1 Tax=Lethenteron reissneri TaxID=7753 RepID=UPI002AB7722A|nr:regulating synaptic membrane exocytosis protein 4-like [Lethenteron reissneri]XP_061405289.1 regulating synaptic membrane exocytosis protein 4-like isoform X1 [Lethenteron reissneri]
MGKQRLTLGLRLPRSTPRRNSLSSSLEALSLYLPCLSPPGSHPGAGVRRHSTVRRSTETGLAAEPPTRSPRGGAPPPAGLSPRPTPTPHPRASVSSRAHSLPCESTLALYPQVRLHSHAELSGFLDGLGPGQVAGRQSLATLSLGDVELGVSLKDEGLTVDLLRARNLVPKPGAKTLPLLTVKVYLLCGGACVDKRKVRAAQRSLEPDFHHKLTFDETPRGKVLQVVLWGDYSRRDSKSFMGLAQIALDELGLHPASSTGDEDEEEGGGGGGGANNNNNSSGANAGDAGDSGGTDAAAAGATGAAGAPPVSTVAAAECHAPAWYRLFPRGAGALLAGRPTARAISESSLESASALDPSSPGYESLSPGVESLSPSPFGSRSLITPSPSFEGHAAGGAAAAAAPMAGASSLERPLSYGEVRGEAS